MNNLTKFESRTQEVFKGWARWYDSRLSRAIHFEPFYKILADILKTSGYLYPGHTLLDIGCGTGEILCRLAREFPSVQFTGLDFSKEMLKRAIEKSAGLSNLKFIHSNIRILPLGDKSYDVILCSDVFHHLEEIAGPLQEIERVSKDSSFFVLADPAIDTMGQKILEFFVKFYDRPKKYYLREELLTAVASYTAFQVQKTFTYHFNNFFVCQKSLPP